MNEAQRSVEQQAALAYEVFRRFQIKLMELLPDELISRVSLGLVQAKILPSGWKGGSEQMIPAVSRKIKYYSEAYEGFLTVLEEVDKGYFGDLIWEMRKAYLEQKARTPTLNYSEQQYSNITS